MMNKSKIMLILIAIALSLNIANGQRIIINNDSLINHFRIEPPYEALRYYTRSHYKNIDYKALYYDEEMKNYLLKWLDKDVTIEYILEGYRDNFSERFKNDENDKISFVRDFMYRELKLDFDSVCIDSTKIEYYTDLAVNAVLKYNKQSMLETNELSLLPDDDVLLLHSKIVYPEAYLKIKQLWKKEKKKNNLFYFLLRMNDPEAQAMFDRIIKENVDNPNNYTPYNLFVDLEYMYNAYSIKKLIELSSVTEEYAYLAGYDKTFYKPLDILILELLINKLKQSNIKIDNLQFDYKNEKKYIKQMRNRKKEIISATKQIIEKLESEEQYWMENIPFDYTQDLPDKSK